MDVPKSRGGREARIVDQVAVWEQLGRVTNALCWCFSEPQGWMFEACTEEQIQRFILPLMSGARKECYAITESGSGSDVSVETTARHAQGRIPHRRREVVRHEREPRGLFHPAGADRGWPACGLRLALLHRQGDGRASRSSARRSSATRSARTTRLTASRTSSCRRASVSAPRATACASRTPGSGASGS